MLMLSKSQSLLIGPRWEKILPSPSTTLTIEVHECGDSLDGIFCRQCTSLCDLVGQAIQKKEKKRANAERQAGSISPTTRSDLSLPDYKAFYVDNDHFKERSSGSTTTHVDFSQYDSFIFDLSNDQFPPADRSDLYHEEFADELTHIISASTTNVNVPLEDDQSSLFAYVVWIFLAFLTYPVVPPYLLSTGNEDTIFDPGISIYHSFMPDVSHRSGTFMKFNDFPDCEDSRACSIHKSFTSSASF
ncbi:hypothetical protein Tco_1028015 [Tanacetum coccineum]